MNPGEIQKRTETLTHACIKVAAVLQAGTPVMNYCRGELVRHASDLAIITRGLITASIPSVFAERLNKSVDSCNGCAFWLELVMRENALDENIVMPLIQECNQLGKLFVGALKSARSKMDS